MKKLRIYLDTSVVSFLFADDAPEKRDVTVEFFGERLSAYAVAISEVVLFEISNTIDPSKRRLLEEAVENYQLPVIELSPEQMTEVEALADGYVTGGIIPVRKREDALHVAISTVLGFDILLSWNFRHLANIHKQIQINAFNESSGYLKRLNLLTPLEVMDEEE